MPYDAFKALMVQYAGRGTGDKVRTAKKFQKTILILTRQHLIQAVQVLNNL